MSLRRRMALVVIAGLVASVVAHFADPSGSAGALMFLASGLVLGELLVLRLENGTSIPLSYAVLLVLVASFRVPEYTVVVVGAELISAVLRTPATKPPRKPGGIRLPVSKSSLRQEGPRSALTLAYEKFRRKSLTIIVDRANDRRRVGRQPQMLWDHWSKAQDR